MPLWRRLFKLDKSKIDSLGRDKRVNDRFIPNENFPLKVILEKDSNTYPTKIVNLGMGGFRLQFNPERVPEPDKLSKKNEWLANIDLAGYGFSIAGNLIYTDISLKSSDFSVGFQIDPIGTGREEILTSFYHAIFPVIIGQTLIEIPASDVQQTNSLVTKRMFTGAQGCVASIWYSKDNNSIPQEFEIMVEDLVISGKGNNKLDFYLIPSGERNTLYHSSPVNCAIKGNDEKWAKEFFRWIVMHLHQDFPIDIKNYFLKNF